VLLGPLLKLRNVVSNGRQPGYRTRWWRHCLHNRIPELLELMIFLGKREPIGRNMMHEFFAIVLFYPDTHRLWDFHLRALEDCIR
jgi:hypothetical protein